MNLHSGVESSEAGAPALRPALIAAGYLGVREGTRVALGC
jgi:hypothetical protein